MKKANTLFAIFFFFVNDFNSETWKIEVNFQLKPCEHKLKYNDASLDEITFQFENDKIVSLTIQEPNLTLRARKKKFNRIIPTELLTSYQPKVLNTFLSLVHYFLLSNMNQL